MEVFILKKGSKRVVIAMSAMLLVGAPAVYAASAQVVKGTVLAYDYIVNNTKSITVAAKTKPIIVNGKTYLPVDMVKEATKTNVTVDAKKSTVTFGEKGTKTPLQKVSPNYDDFHNSNSKEYTTIGNEKYDEVLVRTHDFGNARIRFSPQGGYQTLHLEVAALDDFSLRDKDIDNLLRISTFTVVDLDTEKELNSYEVNVKDGVLSFDTNIAGVKRLEIKVHFSSHYRPQADVILPTSYFK